jgi:hypothetical protein
MKFWPGVVPQWPERRGASRAPGSSGWLQQRIVIEIELSDRQIVGGAPVGVHLVEQPRAEGSCLHGRSSDPSLVWARMTHPGHGRARGGVPARAEGPSGNFSMGSAAGMPRRGWPPRRRRPARWADTTSLGCPPLSRLSTTGLDRLVRGRLASSGSAGEPGRPWTR